MKRINCKIELSCSYDVFIDEKIWTAKAIKEWESVFWPVGDVEGLASCIASVLAKGGNPREYTEGFGLLRELEDDGQESWWCSRYPPDKFASGIAYRVIESLDEDNIEIEEKEVGDE